MPARKKRKAPSDIHGMDAPCFDCWAIESFNLPLLRLASAYLLGVFLCKTFAGSIPVHPLAINSLAPNFARPLTEN
jgi:hypothetical protein